MILTNIQKAHHFEPERIYIIGKREANSNSDSHLTNQVSPILTIMCGKFTRFFINLCRHLLIRSKELIILKNGGHNRNHRTPIIRDFNSKIK